MPESTIASPLPLGGPIQSGSVTLTPEELQEYHNLKVEKRWNDKIHAAMGIQINVGMWYDVCIDLDKLNDVVLHGGDTVDMNFPFYFRCDGHKEVAANLPKFVKLGRASAVKE